VPPQNSTTTARGCLFCRNKYAPSTKEQHITSKSLGNDASAGLVDHELVLPPGVVCDKCNGRRLSRVEKALVEWPPISIFRALTQTRNRKGSLVDAVPNTRWTVYQSPKDPRDFVLATRGSTNRESGRDDVARALCKIALETRWLKDPSDAAHARWDAIRKAALGGPLPGNLVMCLTLPENVDDVLLEPACDVICTPNADPLQLYCQLNVVGLVLDLFVGNIAVADGQRTAVWVVDEATGALSGPNSVWGNFRARADRATRLTVAGDGSSNASSGRHASVLPTHEPGIHIELRSPRRTGT
jgi:hypothetical protein